MSQAVAPESRLQKAAQLTIFWLKTSRPGLYFQWVWLYLLPVAGTDAHASQVFWLGLFFATAPLSLLVYGWNDLADRELDRHNPRKDSFLFGARGEPWQLRTLPAAIVAVNLPCFVWLVSRGGLEMALVLAGVVAVNAAYNHPRWGLRGRPPFELVNELGVLLLVHLSVLLNDVPQLPWQTYLYLYVFTVHAHLVGEVMDLEPDRKGGRRTVALALGRFWTKTVIVALVAFECSLLLFVFGDLVLAAILAAGLVWLLADLFVLFKDRVYTVGEMRLFGIAMNIAGYGTILWALYAGTFSRVN
ncbi:MAG: UbiA family prenyltransferase [Acidobacteriota bacterium]